MFPDQPLAQMQENWFTSSTHVPPFRHGADAHSLMSEEEAQREESNGVAVMLNYI